MRSVDSVTGKYGLSFNNMALITGKCVLSDQPVTESTDLIEKLLLRQHALRQQLVEPGVQRRHRTDHTAAHLIRLRVIRHGLSGTLR